MEQKSNSFIIKHREQKKNEVFNKKAWMQMHDYSSSKCPPLLQRLTSQASRTLIPQEEYRAQFGRLNTKQRQVVNFHRRWSKNAKCKDRQYRLDRITIQPQDLSKGGTMISCAPSLHPAEVNISHPTQLEVKTILVTPQSNLKLYITAIYHCPQLPLAIFL